MTTQKALWLHKVGDEFVLGRNDIPEPGPGEVLVKNYSIALNPLDSVVQRSGIQFLKNFPVILGEEGSGVVQKVGEGVTNLAVGDKVFYHINFTFEHKYSAFQEYTLIAADVVGKMPDNLTFDQAASICAGITPFATGTYVQEPHGCGFTAPFESEGGVGKYQGQPILIMAGAASLGQYAIQLAKLSGFSPIITTASLHNRDYLLSLGATHVLDRNLSPAALKSEVARITTVPVTYAFDAVSVADTQQTAYDILAPGGKLVIGTPKTIKEADGSGKKVVHTYGSFQVPHQRQLGVQFMRELTNWLAEGKIKPNIIEVLPGGLNAIAGGLRRIGSGAVSATKLVVHPSETA